MPILVKPDGPIPSRVMVVGEAPGAEEEARGIPFCGMSGRELDRMLHEAGIARSECFVTNVCRQRPPGNEISAFIAEKKKDITPLHKPLHDKMVKQPILDGYAMLLAEIKMVEPNIIITLGNVPLWALTQKWGIMRWRGSMLTTDSGVKVIPTIHPAAVLRQWELRQIAVQDLRRAAKYLDGSPYPKQETNYILQPTFEQVRQAFVDMLNMLYVGPTYLSFDIETSSGHIDCAGIAWSKSQAICVPFFEVLNNHVYWNEAEELVIVDLFRQVLTHPNAQVIGQNILYDSQYTYRHWHFVPRVAQDTMISFHCAFAGLRKSLDFQASLLCENYVQWKPDKTKQKEGG